MDSIIQFIKDEKLKRGKELLIVAHHYQNQQIVDLADITGDSYHLARECALSDAPYIIFCGVRFMAEGARVLARDNQKIIIPDLEAGCPLADMININQAESVQKKISDFIGEDVIPIVYINSNTEIKDYCDRFQGSTCTSSNAKKIIAFFLNQNRKIFFLPDYNLGYNTTISLGLDPETLVKVGYDNSWMNGTDPSQAKIFLWDGYCSVHKIFHPGDIESKRKEFPGIKVIVHPECDPEVVKLSDYSGSTQYIYDTVSNAPEGSKWTIGTEVTFVERLSTEFPGKIIKPLKYSPCYNMRKITLEKLAATLCSLNTFEKNNVFITNEVTVSEKYSENAQNSLEKMIVITEEKI